MVGDQKPTGVSLKMLTAGNLIDAVENIRGEFVPLIEGADLRVGVSAATKATATRTAAPVVLARPVCASA